MSQHDEHMMLAAIETVAKILDCRTTRQQPLYVPPRLQGQHTDLMPYSAAESQPVAGTAMRCGIHPDSPGTGSGSDRYIALFRSRRVE